MDVERGGGEGLWCLSLILNLILQLELRLKGEGRILRAVRRGRMWRPWWWKFRVASHSRKGKCDAREMETGLWLLEDVTAANLPTYLGC